jgi:hypothetical protein
MPHITLCTSCIAHFNVVHLFVYAIDHAKQEFEEQVKAEDTNPDPEQGKP